MTDFAKEARDRPCTCHPDDNPPKPCPKRYAYSECVSFAAGLAEGLATAAEIARQFNCGLCGMDGKIAEAILSASPTRKDPDNG